MRNAGRGVIVNIGSICGKTGMPVRAAYPASKHGLVGLTRVLAVEWASRGVRVVTVEPAYVRTGLDDQDQKDGGYSANEIVGRTPVGRMWNRARSRPRWRSSPATTPRLSPARPFRSTAVGWPMEAGSRRRPSNRLHAPEIQRIHRDDCLRSFGPRLTCAVVPDRIVHEIRPKETRCR